MPQFPLLESRHNAKFKAWVAYAQHPEDAECPWFPVEGWKNLSDLRQPIELMLFSDPAEPRLSPLLSRAREAFQLAPHLMDALSQVKSPQAVVGFIKKPAWDWNRMTPWVLYLDRLQDPGNLGTLLRTARATGLFSIAASSGSVSCFNAKVVRAAAASLYAVPFVQGIKLEELRQRRYTVWATVPSRGTPLYHARLEPPAAFVIGNEGAGLDAAALEHSELRLSIPMRDDTESLNAGVAGSIIMYEVYRQRMSYEP